MLQIDCKYATSATAEYYQEYTLSEYDRSATGAGRSNANTIAAEIESLQCYFQPSSTTHC
jgi:hypothetical protein